MAFRPDVYVLWQYSPRLIVVEAPSTEITCQDLVDTLRDLEDELDALDDEVLLTANTSGKADLQDGNFTAITAELNNAKLSFEGRTADIEEGTVTTPDSGGTLLVDAAADFIAAGVQPGNTVINYTDHSSAAVVEVVDANTLITLPLTGGTDNDWGAGDHYHLYATEQCFVRGGNLLAVDALGDPLVPTFTTPHVSIQIEKATASALVGGSATQQDVSDNTDTIIGYIGQKIL